MGASLRFFDTLVNTSEKDAMETMQDYTKYALKYYSKTDSGTADKRKEFLETAEKEAIKKAKQAAVDGALKGPVEALEKAIKAATDAGSTEDDLKDANSKL